MGFPVGMSEIPGSHGGFNFGMNYAEDSTPQFYCHTETEPVLEDIDIKMNEYVTQMKPEKMLVYQNHLFKIMQPKKTQIDINIENLPDGIHYTHILEFFKFNSLHTEPKQVYIKVRGPKKNK